MAYDKAIRDTLTQESESNGAILFSPMMFKVTDLSGGLEKNEIGLRDLMDLGKTATRIKKRFSVVISES